MTTTYFLNVVAGNVYGSGTLTPLPSKYYIGLSTTAPNINGTNVTEPSGSGYTRMELTSLGAPSSGVVTNTAAIDFPESTASWGTATHFVIYDALTNGNLLQYGPLSTPRSIEPATIMSIPANYLNLSMQNPV
jgi:hypothetical protein